MSSLKTGGSSWPRKTVTQPTQRTTRWGNNLAQKWTNRSLKLQVWAECSKKYRKYRKWVFSSQWKFPCRKQPWKEWGKEEKSVEGKKWRRKKRGFAVLNVQPAKYTGLVRYRYSDIYARWPKMVDVLDFIPVSASCLLLDPLWKTNIIYHSDQEVFRLGLKHEQSWKGNLQSVRLYLHSTFPRTDHNRNTRTSGL